MIAKSAIIGTVTGWGRANNAAAAHTDVLSESGNAAISMFEVRGGGGLRLAANASPSPMGSAPFHAPRGGSAFPRT